MGRLNWEGNGKAEPGGEWEGRTGMGMGKLNREGNGKAEPGGEWEG